MPDPTVGDSPGKGSDGRPGGGEGERYHWQWQGSSERARGIGGTGTELQFEGSNLPSALTASGGDICEGGDGGGGGGGLGLDARAGGCDATGGELPGAVHGQGRKGSFEDLNHRNDADDEDDDEQGKDKSGAVGTDLHRLCGGSGLASVARSDGPVGPSPPLPGVIDLDALIDGADAVDKEDSNARADVYIDGGGVIDLDAPNDSEVTGRSHIDQQQQPTVGKTKVTKSGNEGAVPLAAVASGAENESVADRCFPRGRDGLHRIMANLSVKRVIFSDEPPDYPVCSVEGTATVVNTSNLPATFARDMDGFQSTIAYSSTKVRMGNPEVKIGGHAFVMEKETRKCSCVKSCSSDSIAIRTQLHDNDGPMTEADVMDLSPNVQRFTSREKTLLASKAVFLAVSREYEGRPCRCPASADHAYRAAAGVMFGAGTSTFGASARRGGEETLLLAVWNRHGN